MVINPQFQLGVGPKAYLKVKADPFADRSPPHVRLASNNKKFYPCEN